MPFDRRVLNLGRRGMMLLVLAALWAYIGTTIALNPTVSPGLFHTGWPLWLRLIEWFGAAVIAAVFAWRAKDWPGWVALMIPPILRAGSFLWGWILWLIPGGGDDYALGAYASVLYLLMIAIVAVASGWPDHPARLPTPALIPIIPPTDGDDR